MSDQAGLVAWNRNHQVKLIPNLEALLRPSFALKANLYRQLALESIPVLDDFGSHLDGEDSFKTAQRFDLAIISQRIRQAHLLPVEQHTPCLSVSDNARVAQPDHDGQTCRCI